MKNHKEFQKLSRNKAQVHHFLEMKPINIPAAEKMAPGPAQIKNTVDPGTIENQAQQSGQDDYIVRSYRLLSAIVLSGTYVPIDYSTPGLFENVQIFNRTLMTDHSDLIRNAMGSVKNARLNNSTTPPGIDGDLYVLANPKDPVKADISKLFQDGHLNRCSVSIIFNWKQSHEEMDEDTFWDSIDTIVNDQLVRVVVTKILQICEVSLVYFGADETAGSLENEEIKHGLNQDVKDVLDKQDKDKEVNMDEKLALIKAHFKKYLNRDFTTDIELVSAVETILDEVVKLRTEKQNLESQVTTLQKHETFELMVTQKLKDKVISLARAFNPNLDTDDLDRYQNSKYEKLTQYQAALENKVKLQCNACGSHDIARRSSVEGTLPVNQTTVKENGAYAPIKMP